MNNNFFQVAPKSDKELMGILPNYYQLLRVWKGKYGNCEFKADMLVKKSDLSDKRTLKMRPHNSQQIVKNKTI